MLLYFSYNTFPVLPHLFQYRKGSTRTGGRYDPATGYEFVNSCT
jgi:hypothetical protein